MATLKSSSSRGVRTVVLAAELVFVSDLVAAPDLAASEPVGVAMAEDMVMLADGCFGG